MVRIDLVKKRRILISIYKAVAIQTSEGEATENRQYYNESVSFDWVLNAKVKSTKKLQLRSNNCH